MNSKHNEYKSLVESRLSELLKAPSADFACGEKPALLTEAMKYSLLAGGKRLRPCMLLAACEMLGGDINKALDFACAMEMIHTYSLIHDDLPGMDNDVLRRGRPTNHVVYGEGQAILAGDGLLSYAFETMLASALKGGEYENALKAMNEIAWACGTSGMVAGQCADLYAENNVQTDENLLVYIHKGKTAAMFMGAVAAGASIAGAKDEEVELLKRFAEAFGRLFQVTDDILDITADGEFGKSKGKDAEEGKLTAISVYGLEEAQTEAKRLKNEAEKALEPFGEKAAYFIECLNEMYERKH